MSAAYLIAEPAAKMCPVKSLLFSVQMLAIVTIISLAS